MVGRVGAGGAGRDEGEEGEERVDYEEGAAMAVVRDCGRG